MSPLAGSDWLALPAEAWAAAPWWASWVGAGHPLALALDVGGTKSALALVRPSGELLPLGRWTTPAAEGGARVLGAALGEMARVRAALGGHAGAIVAIGIAAAGVIDPGLGRVVAANDHLPGWAGIDLAGALGAAGWTQPWAVENDADAAAWGEHVAGAGRGSASMAMLTVGTGVGGGAVLGGQLLRGRRHRAMEVGGWLMDPAGPVDPSGRRGGLECLAAGPALQAAGAPLGWDAPGLLAAAAAGDAQAIAARAPAVGALARAIQNLALALDPELIVVGGGVAEAPGYLEAVRLAMQAPALAGHLPYPPEAVVPAALGNLAGLAGVGALALAKARCP